jgi:hypothetical protein
MELVITERVMNSWTILSQKMRLESLTMHQRVSSRLRNESYSFSGGKNKKCKQAYSIAKILASVFFWDRKGILLIYILPCGEVVNADRYYAALKRLHCAIQNCQRDLLTSGLFLLHDSAQHHTAEKTRTLFPKKERVFGQQTDGNG